MLAPVIKHIGITKIYINMFLFSVLSLISNVFILQKILFGEIKNSTVT